MSLSIHENVLLVLIHRIFELFLKHQPTINNPLLCPSPIRRPTVSFFNVSMCVHARPPVVPCDFNAPRCVWNTLRIWYSTRIRLQCASRRYLPDVILFVSKKPVVRGPYILQHNSSGSLDNVRVHCVGAESSTPESSTRHECFSVRYF